MYAKRCNVTVKRINSSGINEIIPKECYEHEIPLLQRAFGKGSVKPIKAPRMVWNPKRRIDVEAGKRKYPIEIIDYSEEYARLQNIYGRDQTEPKAVVEICYGYEPQNQLEQTNHMRYAPLIEAGHTVIKTKVDDDWAPPADPTNAFDDVQEMALESIDPDFIKEAAIAQGDTVNPEDDDFDFRKSSVRVDPTSLVDNPEHLTVAGIRSVLDDLGVEYDPGLPKSELYTLMVEAQQIPDEAIPGVTPDANEAKMPSADDPLGELEVESNESLEVKA